MPRAIIDITPSLSAATPVFPGDPSFERRIVVSMMSGEASSSVSAAFLPLHAGAHMDAPLHVVPGGFDIADVPLTYCMGEAFVVDCTEPHVDCPRLIGFDEASRLFEEENLPERILFKTRNKALESWTADFAALSSELVSALVERGVKLIGLDVPSIDPAESETLPAHHAALDRGVVILENLQLAHVKAGRYELIALPLKMPGAEASPVRAVLCGML